MSCVEKHALLLKYKLYVNTVVAELAGLKAALISIESVQWGALVAQTVRLRLVRYSVRLRPETGLCPGSPPRVMNV